MDTAKLATISEQLQRAENDLIKVGETLNDAIIKLSLLIKNNSTPQQNSQPKFAPGEVHPDNPNAVKSGKTPGAFIETVKTAFPESLEKMLGFEDKGDYVQIKPKQFLGTENFAKVAEIIRAKRGEYISAGRDSHFRIYRQQ